MELTKEQKDALCQPIDFDILAHIKFQKKISESKFRVPTKLDIEGDKR